MTRLPLAASLLACSLIVLGSGLLSHCGEKNKAGNVAYAHTEAIVNFGPRPPGSPALDKSRNYVSEQLAKHGWVTQKREFSAYTPKGNVKFTNLVARYAPDGDKPEVECRRADSADRQTQEVAPMVYIARPGLLREGIRTDRFPWRN